MIAYHILCHDNFSQVARLIDALYSEEDCFLIDIDDGKNPDTSPIEKFSSCSNVVIKKDAYIGWGGSGTLRKTIEGAKQLLEIGRHWQYYIVLSGQDLPLKQNSTIKAFLSEGHKSATSYIRAVEKTEIKADKIPVVNEGEATKLWSDRGHTKVYAEPRVINPQHDMYARVLVDVTEVSNQGAVYLSNCSSILLRRRVDFFRQYPLFAGANWFNLHRSLVEYMFQDPFFYELFDVLRSTFIPDESFFQTYIMNSVFRDRTNLDYGRLILRPGIKPRVKVFDMSDWPIIENSKELYARKFDTRHDQAVIDKVLSERR